LLPGQKLEERAVTAEMRLTPAAPGEVRAHRGGLFRSQLLIQIFPEAHYNPFTIHSILSCHKKLASGLPSEQ
jgi:hypothetical protein